MKVVPKMVDFFILGTLITSFWSLYTDTVFFGRLSDACSEIISGSLESGDGAIGLNGCPTKLDWFIEPSIVWGGFSVILWIIYLFYNINKINILF